MLSLIAPIVGVVVTTSVGIAVDNAAKIIIPPTSKALLGFGIKAGTAITSFIIGHQVSRIVTRNVTDIIETVTSEAEVDPA